MTMSNIDITISNATPAIEAAAKVMRPDFRKDLEPGELGVLMTTFAGLSAAFDAVDLEEVLFSHTRWELSLLQADGPAIVCLTCREKVVRDVVLDDEFGVDESEDERVVAAMKAHHAASVRAAFLGGVAR